MRLSQRCRPTGHSMHAVVGLDVVLHTFRLPPDRCRAPVLVASGGGQPLGSLGKVSGIIGKTKYWSSREALCS